MLQGVQVQHELRQRAVQAGNLTLHHHKTGTGELDAVLEVHALGRFTQIDVIAHWEAELARGAPAAYFHVVVLVAAHRGGVARQVGDGVGDGLDVGQQCLELDLAGLQLVVDLGHLGLERSHIFAATGSLTDGLGAGVALGLQLLGTGLQILAFLFQSVDSRYVQRVATCSQTSGGLFDIAAQIFGIQHGLPTFFNGIWAWVIRPGEKTDPEVNIGWRTPMSSESGLLNQEDGARPRQAGSEGQCSRPPPRPNRAYCCRFCQV